MPFFDLSQNLFIIGEMFQSFGAESLKFGVNSLAKRARAFVRSARHPFLPQLDHSKPTSNDFTWIDIFLYFRDRYFSTSGQNNEGSRLTMADKTVEGDESKKREGNATISSMAPRIHADRSPAQVKSVDMVSSTHAPCSC